MTSSDSGFSVSFTDGLDRDSEPFELLAYLSKAAPDATEAMKNDMITLSCTLNLSLSLQNITSYSSNCCKLISVCICQESSYSKKWI